MKKHIFIAVLSMAFITISCVSDDAVDILTDVACDIVRPDLQATVQTAIDAYQADMTSEMLCEAARTAIETYESNECGDNTFSQTLAGLPDCSTVNAGM